jgi:hypothetical protein
VEEVAETPARNFDGAQPAVAVAIMLDEDGQFSIVGMDYQTSRPIIYQAIGLLDQVRLDLLASVPANRPLREPEDDGSDDDDDAPLPPIGQA